MLPAHTTSSTVCSDMDTISSITVDSLNNNGNPVVAGLSQSDRGGSPNQLKPKNRGHSLCEVPGCTRLSRKGPTSERAKYCTRHGGGRPCQYPGCRVAARGLLGYCYKHRRFGNLAAAAPESSSLPRHTNGRTLRNSDNHNSRRTFGEELSAVMSIFPTDADRVMCSTRECMVNHTSPFGRFMCPPSTTSHTTKPLSYLSTATSIDDLFRNPCITGMTSAASAAAAVASHKPIVPLQVMRF